MNEERFVEVAAVYQDTLSLRVLLVRPYSNPTAWRLPMGKMDAWENRDGQAMYRILRAETGLFLTLADTQYLAPRGAAPAGYLPVSVYPGGPYATSRTGIFMPDDMVCPPPVPGRGIVEASWVPFATVELMEMILGDGEEIWDPHRGVLRDLYKALEADARVSLCPPEPERVAAWRRGLSALRGWWRTTDAGEGDELAW